MRVDMRDGRCDVITEILQSTKDPGLSRERFMSRYQQALSILALCGEAFIGELNTAFALHIGKQNLSL